ncbi:hypothetical protein VSDG_06262 [Cytospora chrysosperma]|uniref:Uncharacterized protein n=1 Tax=Cytospora chrysosperma TaxID=252740 RepID=A0A423VSP5_CYTCH|nr:hypothetical protein VSDG_06262 [Valsa sordida]
MAFVASTPFSSTRLAEFDSACAGQRTFAASEFQIHDLHAPEPKGLWPYGNALKLLFGGRPYPGDWDGMDPHGYERNLLKMDYTDVPVKVREWIEKQEKTDGPGKGLFGIYDIPEEGERVTGTAQVDDVQQLDQIERVAIFAPGALYETLPLWVAEASDCEDILANMDKYSPKLVDGGVFYDVAAPYLYRSIDLSRTKQKNELRHLEVITALFLRKPELGRSNAIRRLAAQIGTLPQLSSTESGNEGSGPVEGEGEDEDEVEDEDGDENLDLDLVPDDVASDVHSNWSTTDGSDSEDDPDDVMPTDAGSALELAQSSEYFRDAILLALLVQCLSKLTSLDLELMEPARLRFFQALLRLSGAGQLLGHVKTALRTFIYDIGEGTNEMEPPVNISYKSVRVALEQQKDSLEQIWIDYPHDYLFDEWGGAGSATHPMGSFAGFEKLKRFRIASTYLFGFTADTDVNRLVESLPEQLEMLHLTHGDEDEEITAGLQKLLEAKHQGRFQNLRELSVEVCLPWLITKGRPPLAADHTRVNKDVMAELVQKADGMELEMRLFMNHSQFRTYSPPRRVQSATRAHWTGPERKESKWGFDGEVNWPPRMSGCMARPDYPEIKIDEHGTIRYTNGEVPASSVSSGILLGPTFLGPILFD